INPQTTSIPTTINPNQVTTTAAPGRLNTTAPDPNNPFNQGANVIGSPLTIKPSSNANTGVLLNAPDQKLPQVEQRPTGYTSLKADRTYLNGVHWSTWCNSGGQCVEWRDSQQNLSPNRFLPEAPGP